MLLYLEFKYDKGFFYKKMQFFISKNNINFFFYNYVNKLLITSFK